MSIIAYVLIIIYAVICVPIMFKYNPLIVLTGSMEPTFKTGSIIYYKKVLEDELKEGDVITFNTKSGKLVSHRIISIDNGLYETKGDANSISDVSKVRYENIQGKDANISIPYLGYYVKFVNENLTVVVIFVVIILVSEFLFSNTETFDINRSNGRRKKDGKEK